MTEHEAGARISGVDLSLLEQALGMLPHSSAAVLDRESRVLAAFGAALAEAGFSVDLIVGRTLAEIFAPDTMSQLSPGFERALLGESSSFELVAVDGVTWYLFDLKPILESGEVVAVFAFAAEITKRKSAEAEVQREKQFLEDVLDSIDHLVSVKDNDRRMLHINRGFENYTGIRRESAIGMPAYDLFPLR